jgi:hypothetical protein
MPPGQPVRRCSECELLRPCRRLEDAPVCAECAPGIEPLEVEDVAAADGGPAT